MEDGSTENYPVEFRGLSSHYLATSDVQAAFRYSESFVVNSEDYVGLFGADKAGSAATAEVGVRVGDPSLHRPCDGGIWKQGVVTILSSQLPTTGGAHRLCYVNRRGEVCGKSATFTLCRDMSEFPSITIQSAEDHVLIAKLREQSPPTMSFERVDECLVLEAVGMHTTGGSSAGSSFQIVTEEKKVDEDDAESEREERTRDSGETEDQLAPTAREEENLHFKIISLSRETQDRSEEQYNQSQGNLVAVCKSELEENATSVEYPLISEKVECVGEGVEGSEMMKDLSLSESTVLVERVTASEGWRAKQQNKELREKIRILTAKMTGMRITQEEMERKLASERQENQSLRDELSLLHKAFAELEEEILKEEEQKRQIEADNSQLLEKVDQLENELKVISEHDRQILQQMQTYKTELCVLRSEKEVVEGRLQHMEKRRRAKHAAMADKEKEHRHHSDKKEDTPRSTKAPTKQEQHKALKEQHKAPAPRHKPQNPKPKPPEDPQHGVDKQPQLQSRPAAARPAKHAQGMTGAAPAPAVSQTNGLSEERIQEITRKLKGTESFYECPVCHKQLLSRESEYSASLHIEHCLRN